ncbi:SusD/RagB family nutrient-binding outer membrane lipoprotein [Flagellimonas meridianipacifica]|uniref:SusD-like starch-binding protein associating with outer membrane n=1 Tax=Flagellimonas meridianipacifica TaxID=1080225 RepID=A0A2T0MEZ5_9FLAO|nr:SusD/RagB family nutrient-binding outer membrane lipoprotein [Allomuricauda pacifica]PRX56145.1 SusD-like starch-binding protein associating with outer membrane [Allomuricauda pacifica]
MKKVYNKHVLLILIIGFLFVGCEKLVDDINENPNNFTLDELDPGLFLNGAELNSINILLGSTSRMAGYWSGQLIGFDQTELERYNYNVTFTDFDWDGYQEVVTPLREIRSRTPDNKLYQGITGVLEAQIIGNYASMYGDIVYSNALLDIDNPEFDGQAEVFDSLQSLLDDAISNLSNVTPQDVVLEDFLFNGNAMKWLQSAWTLKARFYMLTRQYDQAYAAAQNGISLQENSMIFVPLDLEDVTSTKNKFWIILNNAPSVGTGNSYLIQLLDTNSGISRNNAKTDEAARLSYYRIDETNPDGNLGIANELEPQPLVTYGENLLILAEAGARAQGFNIGLGHLNAWRSALGTGNFFNSSVAGEPILYDAYTAADFAPGGMENADSIDSDTALLREIIEERYVTGFTTFMPFDDARRLRTENEVAVPFPNNTSTAPGRVERFLYPEDEVLANTSVPEDPGLFVPNPINQ